MLSNIFEEASLREKSMNSIASGDWSGWTAGELDKLVNYDDIDVLIGKIIRSDESFPDNLWEGMRRVNSDEKLSESIKRYMIDEERGELHLDQSYWDRMNRSDQEFIKSDLKELAFRSVLRKGTSETWPDSEREKAKEFVNKLKAQQAAKTRKGSKHARAELHPVQTEHWRRLLPDQMPTEKVSWDVIRSKLKTKDKQQIDMVLREMEKNGLITQNEYGNKMFEPAKYQELMAKPKTVYPFKISKDFRGKYHNIQMIRGNKADAAQISVGLPDETETKWKTEHPKLYKFLTILRSKKTSSHASMMTSKNAIGWVRIDKLSGEDWLIEELQQDIDDIMKPDKGEWVYKAKTHADTHKSSVDSVETLKERIKTIEKAIPLLKQWAEIVKANEEEWRNWEVKHQGTIANAINFHSGPLVPAVDARAPDSLKKNIKIFKEAYDAAYEAGNALSGNEWFRGIDVQYLAHHLTNVVLTDFSGQLNKKMETVEKYKNKIEKNEPESSETQEWLRDHVPVKEFVKEFPRMAMHAVKLAAKQHGVKRLWWVNKAQKEILGHANPPRSSTSDELAKKFGFKKVYIKSKKDVSDDDPSYPIANTELGLIFYSNIPDSEKYLWMVPVDDMVTESRIPLDISLFG